MKDSNVNPLPPDVDPEQMTTIYQFLQEMRHEAGDMERAAVRFGRAMFDRYRQEHGHNPYTIRQGDAGPVKVYDRETDRALMFETYAKWLYRERNKQTSTHLK